MIKTNVAYALGSAANSAALFVLIPYLVNVLPPEAYGAWAIYEIILILMVMLITAGMEVGLMREYWFLEDEQARRRLVGTIFSAVLIWGLLLVTATVGLVMTAMLQGSSWLNEYGGASSITLIALIGLCDALFTVALTILRIREQAVYFVLISTGKLLILVAGVIAGVQLLGGIEGALIGRVAASVLPLIVSIWLVRERIAVVFERPMALRALRYGLPLLPTGIAAYVLFAADRYMLQAITSLELAAIYTFAYKIATTLDVLVTRPFGLDWAARRFKIAAQPDAQGHYAEALLLYLFSAGAVTLLILAGTPFAYAWIAPPIYAEGAKIVPIILLAYIIYGLSLPLNVGIMLRDKTIYLPVVGVVSAILCIGLNLWWIPHFGMAGAAWATVVAYLVWTGSITIISLYLFPIRYPLRRLTALIASIIIGVLALWLIDTSALSTTLPITSLILRLLWVCGIGVLMALVTFGYNRGPVAGLLRWVRSQP